MHRLATFLLTASILGAGNFQIEANIRYTRDSRTVLDIVQPRAPALKERVCVILIPAPAESKESAWERIGKAFVEHGWMVAAIEYREDHAEEDVLRATQWVTENAARYKIDAGKIIVAGRVSLASRAPNVSLSLEGLPDQPFKSKPLIAWLKKHKIQ
jgi:hypothetical protein